MAVTLVEDTVGDSIPPGTAHAVSVSLPTWAANVGYEEGKVEVVSKMTTGYPRFFIHKSIARFASAIASRFGQPDEDAMLFPTPIGASRCVAFVQTYASQHGDKRVRQIDLVANPEKASAETANLVSPAVSAVLFPQDCFSVAKSFWQHSGEGVSSRRAEYCHKAFDSGILVEKSRMNGSQLFCKGPKRYQRHPSTDITGTHAADEVRNTDNANEAAEIQDPNLFVEERFGRNLNVAYANSAKTATRRRIAGNLTADVELEEAVKMGKETEKVREGSGFSEDDVYLYPTGMNAIFNTHRSMLKGLGQRKSIMLGFPYVDTLKILEKFGPGCQFYGRSSDADLDDLERRLEGGERFLALFCEFPGNPLLICPNLQRIRSLADKYDFAVVVDETIGNFINVNVLPHADVVVSSLTKIFSGESNVMGGSAILNPKSRLYSRLKKVWSSEYEDNLWAEDAIYLERNSRDFVARIDRINVNAEAICDLLAGHPRVKQVNYPKLSPSRPHYDSCRNPRGGYGGLLSATFYSMGEAIKFYDNLDTAKGPSLGTNFTLSSPYVILAHYAELEWAASYGVEANLVRFSVGLEDTEDLVATFQRALDSMV